MLTQDLDVDCIKRLVGEVCCMQCRGSEEVCSCALRHRYLALQKASLLLCAGFPPIGHCNAMPI